MNTRILLALLLTVVTQACAAHTLVPSSGFTHSLGREHPLAGRIYSRAKGTFVDPAELDAALAKAELVLVGETHDNVDHHVLEAELLRRFLKAHPKASAAFEMLDETQAHELVQVPQSADELAQRVRWNDTGWPEFALYRPVFAVAVEHEAKIIAAHPSREHVRAAMHGVSAEEEAALFLSQGLSEEARASLAEEIRESHCGHAPEAMIEPMIRAQSYKDAFMARATLHAKPAVLFAGTGHIREDRGVPLFLTRASHNETLTIALLGVDDTRTDPKAYESQLYDFIVFTPRVSDEDPCARFAEQLRRMREAKGTVPNAR